MWRLCPGPQYLLPRAVSLCTYPARFQAGDNGPRRSPWRGASLLPVMRIYYNERALRPLGNRDRPEHSKLRLRNRAPLLLLQQPAVPAHSSCLNIITLREFDSLIYGVTFAFAARTDRGERRNKKLRVDFFRGKNVARFMWFVFFSLDGCVLTSVRRITFERNWNVLFRFWLTLVRRQMIRCYRIFMNITGCVKKSKQINK